MTDSGPIYNCISVYRSVPQFWSYIFNIYAVEGRFKDSFDYYVFLKKEIAPVRKTEACLFHLNVSQAGPFLLLHDYLQYHIPFSFMLVDQLPLLHISAEIYYEKDTNICWR